jgi:aminoacrylate hydrolase
MRRGRPLQCAVPIFDSAGAQINYTIAGQGPAVLMIQGVGVIGDGWRPQVDALARSFTVVTFDNRGIGRSSDGGVPLSIEAMAGDAIALMRAQASGRFHVIGHSMGGLIAQEVALCARERVASLSLLCTFARGREATALSLQMLALGVRTRIGTRRMRRLAMLRMIMPRPYLRTADRTALAAELQQLFGRDLADQPPIVAAQLRAMSRYSAAERLHELSGIPTLVLSAHHDPIAPPRYGDAIARGIRGARFVEFPHASHALPIQCADEVNALLLEHVTAAERRGHLLQ